MPSKTRKSPTPPRIRADAGDRDRGCRLHRLARRRRAARAWPRRARARRSLEGHARAGRRVARAARRRHPRAPDEVFDAVAPRRSSISPRRPTCAVSVERPDYDAEVNVLGTARILEAARRHDAKIVFSSTGGAIYGECDGPAPETRAATGRSRRTGRRSSAARSTSRPGTASTGRAMSSLRFGNVYGPRQEPHGEAGVVAIFMGLLRDGGTPTIFGDGSQTRDYVFVDDVVRRDAARIRPRRRRRSFNVGTGTETSVLELYDAIQQVSGIAARAGARAGAARRAAAERARPDARRAGARLAGGAHAPRRPRRDVGLGDRASEERAARTGESVRAVQHTQPIPHAFPWRTATVVVGVVAAVELVALIGLGATRLAAPVRAHAIAAAKHQRRRHRARPDSCSTGRGNPDAPDPPPREAVRPRPERDRRQRRGGREGDRPPDARLRLLTRRTTRRGTTTRARW